MSVSGQPSCETVRGRDTADRRFSLGIFETKLARHDNTVAVNLLIVEPDRTLLETYCAYFDRVGLETTTATDGRTAVEHVQQNPFDTVLLEPELPDDGVELLRTIARRTDQRPLPVIVVSRSSQFSPEFPVYQFHVKPVLMSKLLESILAATTNQI